MRSLSIRSFSLLAISIFALLVSFTLPTSATAQCPTEPVFPSHQGGGAVACPCFVPGERAGATFVTIPVAHYPIEILKVGIGWGSQFGGAPQTQEQAIKIYQGGLPNPGAAIFSLPGPLMTDGFINTFDVEPLPGQIIVNDTFTVVLEFLNQTAGQIFSPTMVHDGNGCIPGRNVIFAIPGGWIDACAAGVTGDWVVEVTYRQVNCVSTDVEEFVVTNVPVAVSRPAPNPFSQSTNIRFNLAQSGQVDLSVYDVRGRLVDNLANRVFSAGQHMVTWNGQSNERGKLPSGVYFVKVEAGNFRSTQKVILNK
jgi:hypothetical protein